MSSVFGPFVQIGSFNVFPFSGHGLSSVSALWEFSLTSTILVSIGDQEAASGVIVSVSVYVAVN